MYKYANDVKIAADESNQSRVTASDLILLGVTSGVSGGLRRSWLHWGDYRYPQGWQVALRGRRWPWGSQLALGVACGFVGSRVAVGFVGGHKEPQAVMGDLILV
jgi:hypothetical protein